MSYAKEMIIYSLSELGRFHFRVKHLSSARMLSCLSHVQLLRPYGL